MAILTAQGATIERGFRRTYSAAPRNYGFPQPSGQKLRVLSASEAGIQPVGNRPEIPLDQRIYLYPESIPVI